MRAELFLLPEPSGGGLRLLMLTHRDRYREALRRNGDDKYLATSRILHDSAASKRSP
jgi:hypothetical protein